MYCAEDARSEHVLQDLRMFVQARHIAGFIRFSEAAELVLHVLGEPAAESGPLKPTSLRHTIKMFVLEHCRIHGLEVTTHTDTLDNRNFFVVEHLPAVLSHFCQADVPLPRVLDICGLRSDTNTANVREAPLPGGASVSADLVALQQQVATYDDFPARSWCVPLLLPTMTTTD